MTDKVPPFPGKPAQVGQKPPEPWEKAMCPFLTAGEVARMGPPSSIVQLGAEKQNKMVAQACKGPLCALFVSAKLADGSAIHGCAPVFAVNQQMALNQMVATFIQAAEAGARAEAEERAAREKAGEQPLPPPGTPNPTTPTT